MRPGTRNRLSGEILAAFLLILALPALITLIVCVTPLAIVHGWRCWLARWR